jgi:hypothetical protein
VVEVVEGSDGDTVCPRDVDGEAGDTQDDSEEKEEAKGEQHAVLTYVVEQLNEQLFRELMKSFPVARK